MIAHDGKYHRNVLCVCVCVVLTVLFPFVFPRKNDRVYRRIEDYQNWLGSSDLFLGKD